MVTYLMFETQLKHNWNTPYAHSTHNNNYPSDTNSITHLSNLPVDELQTVRLLLSRPVCKKMGTSSIL